MNLARKIKNFWVANSLLSRSLYAARNSWLYRKAIERRVARAENFLWRKKVLCVAIETSSLCNASCSFCPHKEMTRKQGIMSDETFEMVVDRMISDGIVPVGIVLNGFGEPLTDAKLRDRVKELRKRYPTTTLKIHTNLVQPRSREEIKTLCCCGLDEINVSLNATSPEVYEKVMGLDGKRFSQVVSNLEDLIDIASSAHNPKVRLSFAVTKSNQASIQEFAKKYSKRVDSYTLNPVHTWGGAIEDLAGNIKMPVFKTLPCKALWATVTIAWDGKLLGCCVDYDDEWKLPSVRDGVLKAFHCETLNQLRNAHRNGSIPSKCSSCVVPTSMAWEWFIDSV
jgi:radical SAM protein with 4Fe4S-binding SPASM domain